MQHIDVKLKALCHITWQASINARDLAYDVMSSKQDILLQLSWRRTAWHDWLDAEDILIPKMLYCNENPFCRCISKTHQ